MTNIITYTLRLDARTSQYRKKGFPVAVFLHKNKAQKKINLQLFFELKDWNFEKELPKNNKQIALLINKKKNLLDEIHLKTLHGERFTLDQVKKLLLNDVSFVPEQTYTSFYKEYMKELLLANKLGTLSKYENAFNQLHLLRKTIDFTDLNYIFFHSFKEARLRSGNSKNTVHTYLAVFRSVYNEAVRRGVVSDQKPFKDVCKSVFVKANRTKKRNIHKKSIVILESAKHLTFAEKRAKDLFLLLFYFGGQDLKDVYYLKKSNLVNGRVYFMRGKLGDAGFQFDLKIHPKAQLIINLYTVPGEFVFPWRKDFTAYRSFRVSFRRNLIKVQHKLGIKILPLGGSMGVKVARHSFATIAKNLFIDGDLLRELMGHERSEVDTIYKDKYSESVRDAALFKIIS
tara:strand:- start:101 stop:1300 length:1200 start_codon:yes stop_codon:yes gene_type:complete